MLKSGRSKSRKRQNLDAILATVWQEKLSKNRTQALSQAILLFRVMTFLPKTVQATRPVLFEIQMQPTCSKSGLVWISDAECIRQIDLNSILFHDSLDLILYLLHSIFKLQCEQIFFNLKGFFKHLASFFYTIRQNLLKISFDKNPNLI